MSNIRIPGFLGDNYEDTPKTRSSKSSSTRRGTSSVAFQTYMDECRDKINDAIKDASKTLASMAKAMNENGDSNTQQIYSKIDTLLRDFTPEERERILKSAISIMVASM